MCYFLIVFLSVFCTADFSFAQGTYKVVIDAGHGGKDPGNLGNGYREKDIALRVALDVGKELSKNKDINVLFTRKKDVFVELHKRADIANSSKADLFVSIHCDGYSKEGPHGAGTFVLGLRGNNKNLEIAKRENASILYEDNYKENYDYDPNSPESLIGLSLLQEENLDYSLLIAGLIQTNFTALKRFDRKVKQDNFLVLRETIMPSVLVELGFLTNKAEGRFLNTRSGQLKMAKAVAKAIEKYIRQLQLNRVTDANATEKVITQAALPKKVTPKKKVANPSVVKKVGSLKEEVSATVLKGNEKEVYFRVQIAAARNKLTTNNFNFRGLQNIESLQIDGYYKYYYGKTSVYEEVRRMMYHAREVGHKDAFVVAFKNGVKISVKDALKMQ
ncbi:N-acetylmuramoyl-L-alanine amidase [Tenacibaculum sp. SG-28]|nr:N-acetylmuramoyl-L-alanine amidase [Tenacibaculum sp. SG-28]